MHKTLQVMRATDMEAAEFASYRLKEVAYSWFELWEESCGRGALWQVFIDDILIYSRSRKDHANYLTAVLQILYQHKLYVKFLKCEFWVESVTFLGHVISIEGIKVDPQKIAAVKNWPKPLTTTAICSFLGLVGYYRKFVEGFSTLASPYTNLTQKVVKFQWSDACEKSFQELKSRLTTTPVLTLPGYGWVRGIL
ncbi:uncharacterized mitochondrial protein AtMg00860-like [Nicotiana sylvestris]|uniref:uncharacterized mitochondrial protein AtMg00860-like n=1 Tax=Nicotiana sylvestris TaxID=4096 RepID=UPI00388CAE93